MKNEVLVWLALSIVAAAISFPDFGVLFIIRVFVIYAGVTLLFGIIFKKRWPVTTTLFVDENKVENIDFVFTKYIFIPLYIFVIVGCIFWELKPGRVG